MKRSFSSEDLSTPERYRFSVQSTIPRAIGLISTQSKDKIYNLAPFSSYTIATQEPHTLVFTISTNKKGQNNECKDTLRNIKDTGEFIVNVVTQDIVQGMHRAAKAFPSETDEFKVCGLTPGSAHVVTAPLVRESPINIECNVHTLVPLGGNEEGSGTVVIGNILHIHVADMLYDIDGNIMPDRLRPVGRIGGGRYDTGGYCSIRAEDIFRIEDN